jgi:hypothetical protein
MYKYLICIVLHAYQQKHYFLANLNRENPFCCNSVKTDWLPGKKKCTWQNSPGLKIGFEKKFVCACKSIMFNS